MSAVNVDAPDSAATDRALMKQEKPADFPVVGGAEQVFDLIFDVAAEINREHALAIRHAGAAIDHAKRAGELLISVKQKLTHGEWLPWLRANCEVSPRQAQRYIRAHQGAPTSLRAIKNDAVSHLTTLPIKPGFAAIANSFMLCMHKDACFVIEQSTDAGFFFVSRLALIGDDDAEVDYLTRPIRGDYVDLPLAAWGMPDPYAAEWRFGWQERPVASALESFESAGVAGDTHG